MLRKILSALFIVILFAGNSFSQKWKLTRYEAHFGLGTTNLFGDIGGTADKNNLFGLKDIRLKETGMSFYGAIRYKVKADQSIKFNLIYGYTKGSDVGSRNEDRQYSYSTKIFEPSFQYEYYFLGEDRRFRPSNLYNRRGMINNYAIFSFYGFVGIGGVIFTPKFNYQNWVPHPSIETVKTGTTMLSAVIPIGVGLKYGINKFWSAGLEFGGRLAFSDYLDGLSTVFSKWWDIYYFTSFHLIYRIETDRRGRPIFLQRRRF